MPVFKVFKRRVIARSIPIIGIFAIGLIMAVGLARQGNNPETIANQVANLIAQNPAVKIDRDPDQLLGVIEIDITGLETNLLASLDNYKPGDKMAAAIDHLDLTDTGRQLMLDHRPEFITKADMGGFCGLKAHGCWIKITSGQKVETTIVIVSGLSHKQQTEILAHELLHGAYNSIDNHFLLNGLLDGVYTANQAALDHRLEPYGQQTDESRYHELHSFVGTTIADMPSALEAHYGQYFKDRNRVLSHAPGGSHDNGQPPPTPDPEPESKPKPQTTTDPGAACRRAGGDWTGQTCDYRRRDCQNSGGAWFGDSCDRPKPKPTATAPKTTEVGQKMLSEIRGLRAEIKTSSQRVSFNAIGDDYDCSQLWGGQWVGVLGGYTERAADLANLVEVEQSRISPQEFEAANTEIDTLLLELGPLAEFLRVCLDKANRAVIIFIDKEVEIGDRLDSINWSILDLMNELLVVGECDEAIAHSWRAIKAEVVVANGDLQNLLNLQDRSGLSIDDLPSEDKLRHNAAREYVARQLENLIENTDLYIEIGGC